MLPLQNFKIVNPDGRLVKATAIKTGPDSYTIKLGQYYLDEDTLYSLLNLASGKLTVEEVDRS